MKAERIGKRQLEAARRGEMKSELRPTYNIDCKHEKYDGNVEVCLSGRPLDRVAFI